MCRDWLAQDVCYLLDFDPYVVRLGPIEGIIDPRLETMRADTSDGKSWLVVVMYEDTVRRDWNSYTTRLEKVRRFCDRNKVLCGVVTDACRIEYRNRLFVLRVIENNSHLSDASDLSVPERITNSPISIKELLAEYEDERTRENELVRICSLVTSHRIELVSTEDAWLASSKVALPKHTHECKYLWSLERFVKRIERHPLSLHADLAYAPGMRQMQLGGYCFDVLSDSIPERVILKERDSGEVYQLVFDHFGGPINQDSFAALQARKPKLAAKALERADVLGLLPENPSDRDFANIAPVAGKSPRTLRRYFRTYKKFGLAKLGAVRKDQGTVRTRGPKNPDTGESQIESVIRERLNADYGRYPWSEIIKRIKKQVSDNGLNPEDIPRQRSLHSRLVRYLTAERLLSTKIGKEAAENKLGAYTSVKLAEFPLHIVQIDCHEMDIVTVFDSDEMGLKEKVITGRPWLTVMKDWYSGRILSAHISLYHPTASSAVFLAIMEACLKYGPPRIIYADNGMVYRADLFIQGCHENGIRPMWARAYTGRDKAALERWFGTLERGLIHYLEGTTMSNPQERADYSSEKEAKYSLEDIRKRLEQFIAQYNATPSEGSIVSPKDRYVAGLSEKAVVPRQIPKESIQRFKISFMRVTDKRRTIQKDGLRFLNMHYIPRGQDRARLPRADGFGKSIRYDFRWDDSDIRRIFVVDEPKNDFVVFLSSEIMSDPHFSPSEPVPLRAWRKVQREKGVGDPSRTLLHYSERDFELRRRASNGDRTAAKELAAERTERTEKLELGLGEAELPATTSNAGLPQTGEEDEDIPKGDLGSGTRTYLEGNEGERDG